VLTADLRLLEAAWARRQGRDDGPALSRALEGAKTAAAASPYADAYRALASVYLALAETHPDRATPDPVAAGLAHAASALRLAPDLAEAHSVRGRLLLARARAARGASPNPADARLARAEIERALALDPLLRRDLEGPLRDAEALGASAP
jgi:serine/threonine-protein kinase